MIYDPQYGAAGQNGEADFSQPNAGGDWFADNAPTGNGNGLEIGALPPRNPDDISNAAARGGITGTAGAAFNGNVQDLWTRYQQENPGFHPTQGAATSLQPFVDWAKAQGANINIASPSSGGYVKGITDPNGQFVKLLDGYDKPIWLPGGNASSSSESSIANFSYPEYGKSFDYPAFTEQFDYQPWTRNFVAPTGADEQNDPGFAFRQKVGEDAVLRGAAKTGVARTQGTIKDLAQFNQDYASNEYGQVYNRALTGYQSDLNDYLAGLTRAQDIYGTKVNAYNMNRGNAAGNFGINYGIYGDNRNAALAAAGFNLGAQGQGFNQNLAMLNYGQGAQGQAFNQQYSLANLGLTAAQLYGANATGYGNNVAGIYTNGAQRQGDYTTQIGNATAAGQVGSANAWNGALSGISNDAMFALMSKNQGKGIYSTPQQPVWT